MKAWWKKLFLKWSGHTCPVCIDDHWDVGYKKWLEDPEWAALIAEQFDEKGNLLPVRFTPRHKEFARQAEERRRAMWEKRSQEELVRKIAARFNKGSI